MDNIALIDVSFGIVTTLLLGALTTVDFVSERQRKNRDERAAERQRNFEDTQFALDIQASTSTSEIIDLLARPKLTAHEREFLKRTHGIAKARMDAMAEFAKLSEPLRDSVEQSLQRLYDVVGDDPDVQSRQEEMNSKHGMRVQNDRSRYSWDGSGSFTKYELLHLIAQRFILLNSITSRAEFDTQFGDTITAVLGNQVAGKTFSAERLLDPVAREGRFEARDAKFVEIHGAIEFDGVAYRAGWSLGFGGVRDIGRVVQLPVIEHFRRQPGYAIEPVTGGRQ